MTQDGSAYFNHSREKEGLTGLLGEHVESQKQSNVAAGTTSQNPEQVSEDKSALSNTSTPVTSATDPTITRTEEQESVLRKDLERIRLTKLPQLLPNNSVEIDGLVFSSLQEWNEYAKSRSDLTESDVQALTELMAAMFTSTYDHPKEDLSSIPGHDAYDESEILDIKLDDESLHGILGDPHGAMEPFSLDCQCQDEKKATCTNTSNILSSVDSSGFETFHSDASRSMNEELKPSDDSVSVVFSSQKKLSPSTTTSMLSQDEKEGLPGMRKGQLHEMMNLSPHDNDASHAAPAVTSENASALGAVLANDSKLNGNSPFVVQLQRDEATGEMKKVLAVDPIAVATATLDVPPVPSKDVTHNNSADLHQVVHHDVANASNTTEVTGGSSSTSLLAESRSLPGSPSRSTLTSEPLSSALKLSESSNDTATTAPPSLPSSSPTELMKKEPSTQSVTRKPIHGRLTGVWSFFSGARSYVPDESDESDASDDEWKDDGHSQSSLASMTSDLHPKSKSLDSSFISDVADMEKPKMAASGIASLGASRRRSTLHSTLSPPYSATNASQALVKPTSEVIPAENIPNSIAGDSQVPDAQESFCGTNSGAVSPIAKESLADFTAKTKGRRNSVYDTFFTPAFGATASAEPEPEPLDLGASEAANPVVVDKVALPSRLLPSRSVRLSIPSDISFRDISVNSPTVPKLTHHQYSSSGTQFRHRSPLPPRQTTSRSTVSSPQSAAVKLSPTLNSARGTVSIAHTPVLSSYPMTVTSQRRGMSNLSEITFAAPWHASAKYPSPCTHATAIRVSLSGSSTTASPMQTPSIPELSATQTPTPSETQDSGRDRWYSRLLGRYSTASASSTPVHKPSFPESLPPLQPLDLAISTPVDGSSTTETHEVIQPVETLFSTPSTPTTPNQVSIAVSSGTSADVSASPPSKVDDNKPTAKSRPKGLRGSIVRQNWHKVTYVPQSRTSLSTSTDNVPSEVRGTISVSTDGNLSVVSPLRTSFSSASISPAPLNPDTVINVESPSAPNRRELSNASCDTVISFYDDVTPTVTTPVALSSPSGKFASPLTASDDHGQKSNLHKSLQSTDSATSLAPIIPQEGMDKVESTSPLTGTTDLKDTSTPASVSQTPAHSITANISTISSPLVVNPLPMRVDELKSDAIGKLHTSNDAPLSLSLTPNDDPTKTPGLSSDSVVLHFEAAPALTMADISGSTQKPASTTCSLTSSLPLDKSVRIDENGVLLLPGSFDEFRKLPLKDALEASFTTYVQSVFLPHPPTVPTCKSGKSSAATKAAARVAYALNCRRNRSAIGSGYSFLPRFGIKIHEVRHFELCPVVAMSPAIPPFPSTLRQSSVTSSLDSSKAQSSTNVPSTQRPRRRGVSFDLDALTPSQRALCHTAFSFWTYQQDSHTSTVSVNDLLGRLKHRLPMLAYTPRIWSSIMDSSHIPKLSLDGGGASGSLIPSSSAAAVEEKYLTRSMMESKEMTGGYQSRRERYLGWVPILGRMVSTNSNAANKSGKESLSPNQAPHQPPKPSNAVSRRGSLSSFLSQRTRDSSVSSTSSIESNGSASSSSTSNVDKKNMKNTHPDPTNDPEKYSLRPLPSQLSSIEFQDGVNLVTFQVVDRRKKQKKVDNSRVSRSRKPSVAQPHILPDKDSVTSTDVKIPIPASVESGDANGSTNLERKVQQLTVDNGAANNTIPNATNPFSDSKVSNSDSQSERVSSKQSGRGTKSQIGPMEEDPDVASVDTETVIMMDGDHSDADSDSDSQSDEEDVIIPNASITCHLFLWSPHAKIIISDVDGTITKSDVLGHLCAVIGKDWTHTGIAELYSNIHKNGYHLLYLTARAIGQIDTTRSYLQNVKQANTPADLSKGTPRSTPMSTPFLSGASYAPSPILGGRNARKDTDPSLASDPALATLVHSQQAATSKDGISSSIPPFQSSLIMASQSNTAITPYSLPEETTSHALPLGPVITSPDRLFSAFKREVIDRQPQIFKIAALLDIARLFPPGVNPFYAGFGNRETDLLSYRAVGIPDGKIFVVNPEGELRPAVNASYVTSYTDINNLVNNLFPSVNNKLGILSAKAGSIYGKPLAIDDRYTDAYWWRRALPSLSTDDIIEAEKATEIASTASGSLLFKKISRGKVPDKSGESKKDAKESEKKSK